MYKLGRIAYNKCVDLILLDRELHVGHIAE